LRALRVIGPNTNGAIARMMSHTQAIVDNSREVFVIYRVTARFRNDTATELRRRLDDGSIAAQQPDGQEIIDSLHRAIITPAGDVQWSEMCFCDPPLDTGRVWCRMPASWEGVSIAPATARALPWATCSPQR
jgi:hypothetical protein